MGNDIAILKHLVTKDFSIDSDYLTHNTSLESLHQSVKLIVRRLLDTDMERLLHICYRLDINENKLTSTLATAEPDQLANQITDLIIARELQKVETRKKYRS